VELYGEICEALLGRWRQAIGIQDPIKSSQKRLVLATLASTMMRRQSAEIVTGEAVQAIAMPLDNIGQAGISGESFLNDLREASGLLQEREASRWSFVHLSFQEFLAADYWLKNKQAEPNWSKMVGDSWWHETLRLYAAQDDATPIVRACLDAERSAGVSDKQKIAALTLAADCFEEATLLNADLRREVEERIVAALESADEALRRRAAEAHLSRRLNSLYPLDDDRAVDVDYLTSAEYQLFLDDMRARGRYHQPEHWTGFTFLPGQARQPVLGVRGEDAQAFCDWLTQRQGGKMLYGLPSRVEATALPSAKTGPLATWRRDGHGFNLTPLPESTEQEIRQRLLSFSTAKFPVA
jgi:hypothetical protein